jgi:hypothetical protein
MKNTDRLAYGLLAALAAFAAPPALSACGDDGGGATPAADAGSPDASAGEGFDVRSPDLTIGPGEEKTYCYYTTLALDRDVGVKHWSSLMTPGSHHMIVYFTDAPAAADGTVEEGCGGFGSGAANIPVWTYSAQDTEAEMKIPAGVGMKVARAQHLYIQMHYLNTTDAPLTVHVQLHGDVYAAGESYVPAAAFVTYNTQIQLAPGATGSFGGRCALPAGVQFFTLSTHAHRRSTHTQVQDGTPVVFASDDWEHPGAADWLDAAYSFSAPELTYRCDYANDTDHVVTTGPSAQTDEMCMAIGYFYPAPEGPKFCINSTVLN